MNISRKIPIITIMIILSFAIGCTILPQAQQSQQYDTYPTVNCTVENITDFSLGKEFDGIPNGTCSTTFDTPIYVDRYNKETFNVMSCSFDLVTKESGKTIQRNYLDFDVFEFDDANIAMKAWPRTFVIFTSFENKIYFTQNGINFTSRWVIQDYAVYEAGNHMPVYEENLAWPQGKYIFHIYRMSTILEPNPHETVVKLVEHVNLLCKTN